jgi:hypothetical protein
MPSPFVNRRLIESRRRQDSSGQSTVEGEVIRIADFDTFYWYAPSVGNDRWNQIPNSNQSPFSPQTASQLVVGLMNPWNHADASNYPPNEGTLTTVIEPRTPTRTAIGFDLSGIPANATITQANLNLTVAQTNEWTTEQYVSSVQEYPDIWCASWWGTDETVDRDGFVTSTGLGNVNRYDLVKPMIPIWDCVDDGGYQDTSALDYISNARGCGRFIGAVNSLLALPPGKRCVRLQRYDNAFPFTAQDDENSQGFQVPWAENEGARIRADIRVVAGAFKNFVVPDYIALDSPPGEYTPLFFWDTLLEDPTTRNAFLDSIITDPRASLPWNSLNESLIELYTYEGKYAPANYTDIRDRRYHPQKNRSYLYWNRAIWGIQSEFMNEYIYRPIKEYWDNSVKLSNYDSGILNEDTEVYDINGHPFMCPNLIGDAAAPVLYASWGEQPASVYGILQSDPTRIVRKDYDATYPIASKSSWNQFLILIQKIRGYRRENANVPLRPWISSISWFGDTGHTPSWNNDPNVPLISSRGLYWESVRHFAISSVEMFNLWNFGDDTRSNMQQNCTKMNAVLTEVNAKTSGFRGIHSLSTERISFLSGYIVSGIKLDNISWLWRVTANPKKRLILTSSNTTIPLPLHAGTNFVRTDEDGGFWMYTDTATTPTFDAQDAPSGWTNYGGLTID